MRISDWSSDVCSSDLILRAMIFVVTHGPRLHTHRNLIKPDIIWNTEKGLKQTPEQLAWAERERAAFRRRIVAFFDTYDLLLLPVSVVPRSEERRVGQ